MRRKKEKKEAKFVFFKLSDALNNNKPVRYVSVKV